MNHEEKQWQRGTGGERTEFFGIGRRMLPRLVNVDLFDFITK